MGKKGFQNISVTELCARAGVSRMAFYRNFGRKEDILIHHLDSGFERYLEEVASMASGLPYDFALRFFRYFRKDRRFLGLLACSGLQTIVLDCFDRYLERILEEVLHVGIDGSPAMRFEIEFVVGGLYKVLMAWISHNANPGPEAMAGIVASILDGRRQFGLTGVLATATS